MSPPILMSEQEDIQIPEDFVCPISLSLMRDPVMSRDGKNFEKKAILDWLNRGNVNCPLTRQPLKPSLLAPNVNLRLKIERWRKTNGAPAIEDDDASASSESSEPGFVGLLHVDESIRRKADNLNNDEVEEEDDDDDEIDHPCAQDTADPVDDELADLLELYNEVLELTSAPFDVMPPSRQAPPQQPRANNNIMPNLPSPSMEAAADAALSVLVARHTARRTWRPKLFPKKKTATQQLTTES